MSKFRLSEHPRNSSTDVLESHGHQYSLKNNQNLNFPPYLQPHLLHQDCEHSVVLLSRPVKLRKTPVRTRQSLRASIIYKGPVQFLSQQGAETRSSTADPQPPAATQREPSAARIDGESLHTDATEGSHLLQKFGLFLCCCVKYYIVVIKEKILNRTTHFRSGGSRLVSYWTVQSPVQLHIGTQWRVEF